jgi:hypothetical protein
LTPEPPPARTFEVVIIGRISKTALDQVLAPSAIAPRGSFALFSFQNFRFGQHALEIRPQFFP